MLSGPGVQPEPNYQGEPGNSGLDDLNGEWQKAERATIDLYSEIIEIFHDYLFSNQGDSWAWEQYENYVALKEVKLKAYIAKYGKFP